MKIRNSNIDLLKISAMLMVVFEHMLIRSGLMDTIDANEPAYYVVWFLRAAAKVNVNIFVLISGYHLCESVFKIKKVALLLVQTSFYSILVYIAAVTGELVDFSIKDLVKSIIPVISNNYWFITCYVGLYLLSPVINMCISKLEQKQLIILTLGVYFVSTIYPNFYVLSHDTDGGGRTLSWFVLLYLTSAVIRRGNFSYSKKYAKIYWYSVIGTVFVKYMADNLARLLGASSLSGLMSVAFANNSPFIYVASVSLFLCTVTSQKQFTFSSRINRIIASLASSSLAVYLIHDNVYIYSLWNQLNISVHNWYGWLQVFVIPVMIYFVCYIVERIRIILWKPMTESDYVNSFFLQFKSSVDKILMKTGIIKR